MNVILDPAEVRPKYPSDLLINFAKLSIERILGGNQEYLFREFAG